MMNLEYVLRLMAYDLAEENLDINSSAAKSVLDRPSDLSKIGAASETINPAMATTSISSAIEKPDRPLHKRPLASK
ncbi:MAG: hypothetical protein HRF49_00380 [bacterium]